MKVSYYIKCPNGRYKIEAGDDDAAKAVFAKHWTAEVKWTVKNPKRILVKEVSTEILTEKI